MNKHAQELGRMGKGKKKSLSLDEIVRRKARLAAARKTRWSKKDE